MRQLLEKQDNRFSAEVFRKEHSLEAPLLLACKIQAGLHLIYKTEMYYFCVVLDTKFVIICYNSNGKQMHKFSQSLANIASMKHSL